LGFALWRNITAVLLVLILVAQSVRLVVGVVHDKFGINETWDSLRLNISDAVGEIYYVSSFFHHHNR
jgi:RPA family protein